MFVSPRILSLALGLALTGFATAKEPFKPNLGPELPRITVTCGDVTLLLRQATQWTPGRIDFRGSAMTTESSAYGTVFSFPDVGFIGTAHLENEPEKLRSLDFFLDNQRIEIPAAELKGSTFRLERKSRIRTFDLTNTTEIKDHRLYETATVHTAEAVPLKLVYHFMHAWRPTMSAFLAGSDSLPDHTISGPLRDDKEVAKKFYINQRVDWLAVYEPKSGQFAVSRLLQVPELGGHTATLWNVPGVYRKSYLKCFESATVPAGFTGTWSMVTAFGTSPLETWEAQACSLAATLRDTR
jgi:hypothetical protein